MLGPLSWRRFAVELITILVITLLLSWLIGMAHFFMILSGLLLLLLGWHYYQLFKLSHWLWLDRQLYPPKGHGSWLPIFHGLHRMRLEQRRERRRLADILKYFRRGAESMPDATILCDASGRLTWCNSKAEQLLGLRWPQDEANNFFNLLRDPELSIYFQNRDYTKPYILAHGHRELECRFYYPYIEDNLLIIVRDITERNIAERSRQLFFANVNHELRIPLTVIQGYVEMLSSSELDDFETKALTRIDEQVARLRHLVEELMLLTRLETATEPNEPHSINLSQLLEEIVDDYIESQVDDSVTDEKERALIECNITPNQEVMGDRNQLTKVLVNLLYNAIEHNLEGTPIIVTVEPTEDLNRPSVRVKIEDRGAGIAPEHLEKLTERFYRVDSSRSRQHSGGSGLGLAIVKHALQNHGTHLIIESRLGEGSCFSFILPRLNAEKPN